MQTSTTVQRRWVAPPATGEHHEGAKLVLRTVPTDAEPCYNSRCGELHEEARGLEQALTKAHDMIECLWDAASFLDLESARCFLEAVRESQQERGYDPDKW
jgi:hypothetical protein